MQLVKHWRQTVSVVELQALLLKNPCAHLEHSVQAVFPILALKVPAAQSLQSRSFVAVGFVASS